MKRQLLLPFLFLWLGLGFVAQAQNPGNRQSDSLALVALYNSTGGPAWTDSWTLTNSMNDWAGVGINPNLNRVTRLVLQGFGLTGDMSNSVGQLDALTFMAVGKNNLTGLPAGLGQIATLDTLICDGNRLTFEDLIPLNQANIDVFTFIPQNFIPPGIRISVLAGDQLSITGPIDSAPGTVYQWLRQDATGGFSPVQQAPSTNPTYTVTQASTIDAGNYFCRITNPDLDDLILRSVETQVQIVVQGPGPRALGQMTVNPGLSPATRQDVEDFFLGIGGLKKTCQCDDEIYMWILPDTIYDGDLIIIGPEEAERHAGGNVPPNSDGDAAASPNYPVNLGLDAPDGSQYIYDAVNLPLSVSPPLKTPVVAIIDLGVDSSHVDIRDQIWTNPSPIASSTPNGCLPGDENGFNFFEGNGNAFIDSAEHGTHITGLLTTSLMAGMSELDIEIMSLKVGDSQASIFDLACAMSYATAKNVDVINLSMGYTGKRDSTLAYVFKLARTNEIVVVTSAGNNEKDNSAPATLHWPSNFSAEMSNVLSVASLNSDGNGLSSFSNFSASHVNLAAPGENINSTIPGGGYAARSGTSIANGFVSLLAAAIKAYKPTFTADLVVANIFNEQSMVEPGLENKVKDKRKIQFGITNCAEKPLTRADTVVFVQDSASITIDVRFNDCYGIGMLPTIESQPANGTVSVDANGKIVYKPNSGFTGIDKFSYRLTANAGGSTDFDTAEVVVDAQGTPNGGCSWWEILLIILLGLLVIILLAWLFVRNNP